MSISEHPQLQVLGGAFHTKRRCIVPPSVTVMPNIFNTIKYFHPVICTVQIMSHINTMEPNDVILEIQNLLLRTRILKAHQLNILIAKKLKEDICTFLAHIYYATFTPRCGWVRCGIAWKRKLDSTTRDHTRYATQGPLEFPSIYTKIRCHVRYE